MKRAVGIGDGLGCKFQTLDANHLECEMVNAGVKGTGEESEYDKGAAPQSQAGPRGANQSGKRGNGWTQENVSCEKSAIGRDYQDRIFYEGRKLLRKEEVELDSKKRSNEEKDGSQNHCDSTDPPTWEPEVLALLFAISALRGSSFSMRISVHD